VVNLGSEYKVAILASAITVAGFAIAFHTATINWRNQMKAQLMLNAASEIEGFFAVVLRNITTTEIHVRSLVETVNQIQNDDSYKDGLFQVDYLTRQTDKFLDARALLAEASVEVHRLISKNHNLLASTWGTLDSMQTSAKALTDITKRMWIRLPILSKEDPKRIKSFVHQVNVSECENYLKTCERCSGIISGLTGGVGGQLQSPVVGFNFSMMRNLFRNKKAFAGVMTELHQKMNDS
jgi:hypothetical protein